MDSTRFDALTRSLATAGTRRALVRTAFGTVVAGLGSVIGRSSALADECKHDGKQCKKHDQCCSGLCVPDPDAESTSSSDSVCCTPDSAAQTCADTCGEATNNCGQTVQCEPCCVPDDTATTCAGMCGMQTNNCGTAVDCGLCGDEICLADDECASGECCNDSCCDETQPSTYVCCGEQGCCDCFDTDFGPDCFSGTDLCGTYPNDKICSPSTTCYNGDCVRPVYLCPFEAGGDDVYCTGAVGAGCCGGVCCPNDKPICADGTCVAEQTCSYEAPSCEYGTCTATKWNMSGTCCTNMHSFENGVDEFGDTIIINDCCGTDEQWNTECHCNPLHWEGCGEPTSRTSYPRIG